MGSSKRYIISIILIFSAIAAYAAFRLLQVDMPDEPKRISVVMENSGSPRWINYLEGIDQAAQDYGVEYSVATTGYYTSDTEEERLREQEYSTGADVVITAVEPDPEIVSHILLQEIISDYGGVFTGRTVAILGGSPYNEFCNSLLNSLGEGIVRAGGDVFWKKQTPYNVSSLLKKSKHTDVVIALDDDSLSQAAAYLKGKRGRGRKLYGVGCSSTSAYYLDKGVISAMVTCDYFTIGYESIEATLKGEDIKKIKIDPRLIRSGEVYVEKNEKLLFP